MVTIHPPVIEGMARRAFFKHLGIGFAIGIVAAEVYWRCHVLPRRQRRDQYYKDMGVEYVHPFN